jgi:hypothetical protein
MKQTVLRAASIVTLFLVMGARVPIGQELDRIVMSPVQPYVIPATSRVSGDVLTQRNNNQRTGVTEWKGLDQGAVAVGRFGLIHTIRNINGVVLAQPLFIESVTLGNERRSLVFIATSTNWLYAFDADPPFTKRWEVHLADPYALRNAYNDHPDDCPVQMAATEREEAAATPQLKETRVIGIESTPVIDRSLRRLFVSYRNASGIQRIAAVDIATGRVSSEHGHGLDRAVTDDVMWNRLHRNRASLLTANGLVYVAFSAACEGFGGDFKKSYQGWIYAFDANTLASAGRYRTTQSTPPLPVASDEPTDGGGIWQASSGLAADARGNVFFSTGNARKLPALPDAAGKNLTSSAVRLRIAREGAPGQRPIRVQMTPGDWFTPSNKLWQDAADMDLGAGGVVLIPGTPYLVLGGKEGILYLLDRSHMGKFQQPRDHVVQSFRAGFNQYCAAIKTVTFCSDHKNPPLEPLDKPTMETDDWLPWPHIHGTPVFGRFGDGRAFLYIWPEKDHLKAYGWTGDRLKQPPVVATAFQSPGRAVLAPPFLRHTIGAGGMPGGMLSLTIDPSAPGRGVLFASVQRCRPSNMNSSRDDCSITRCNTPRPPGDPQFGIPGSNCSEQRFGMLRAFDPITLRELWNDQVDPHAANADKDYYFAKYVPPTIARGRVFLATGSEKVLVYGKY